MDGKKGSAPEKVRPYRLDYRPLIDRDLTELGAHSLVLGVEIRRLTEQAQRLAGIVEALHQ